MLFNYSDPGVWHADHFPWMWTCGETVGVIDSERLVESLEGERLETGYSEVTRQSGDPVIKFMDTRPIGYPHIE